MNNEHELIIAMIHGMEMRDTRCIFDYIDGLSCERYETNEEIHAEENRLYSIAVNNWDALEFVIAPLLKTSIFEEDFNITEIHTRGKDILVFMEYF